MPRQKIANKISDFFIRTPVNNGIINVIGHYYYLFAVLFEKIILEICFDLARASRQDALLAVKPPRRSAPQSSASSRA